MTRFAALLFFACSPLMLLKAQTEGVVHGKAGITLPAPPSTKALPVVDSYKSIASSTPVKVTDPYRYLEDGKSPATRAYIAAQNSYTQRYLQQVKSLPSIRDQLTGLLKVDTFGVPQKRGNRYFFSRRLPGESQASLYVRFGLHGKDERLVDGPSLSKDQNTSATMLDIDGGGTLVVYGLRVGGADEEEVHFLDVATRKDHFETIPSGRYNGLVLTPDGKGVYYSKFVPHEGTSVYSHAFGTPVSRDKTILARSYRGEALTEIDYVSLGKTGNGHYLVLTIDRGVPAKREDVLLKDLRQADSPITPLVYGIESRFGVADMGDDFFVNTDYKAPNHRILKAKVGSLPDQWQTVIAEGKDALQDLNAVNGKLYVLSLHDVKSDLTIYNLDGHRTGSIAFPGLGSASTLMAQSGDRDGFYTFESVITPPTIYHYDTTTGKSEVFASPKVPFDSTAFELKQVFLQSKDGTRVPMFIAGKKGLKADGSQRLLMTGYGGFQISMTPVWNAQYAWWLQQGGWFAMPNLRGGNEYGEAWHQAAMFDKKQNVFDDWFAAARYLIDNKYTSPAHFAISGRSNGGLLMGAAMTQHPELFGAIWCGYPLLDMLRYQLFLVGRTWTTEYGSAENAKDFPYIYKYSPYQHVQAGKAYPAIMFFTGDGDTRVDPMNARKMNALMQASSSSKRPILLHYSVKGGHSSGVSQTQLAQDYADELGFLWTETGQ